MQQIKELLNKNVLSENEKNKKWENITTARMKWWEKEYTKINNSIYYSANQKEIISNEIHQMAQLETDGGKCPKCKKEWQKKEFNNMFGFGKYFQPGCQCYFKCPRCKKHLYDMHVTTRLETCKYTCHSCGWVLMYDGEKRCGLKYELFYDSQTIMPKNINIEKAIKEKKEKKKKKE